MVSTVRAVAVCHRKHFQSAVTLAAFERDSHQLDAANYRSTQKVAKLVIDPD